MQQEILRFDKGLSERPNIKRAVKIGKKNGRKPAVLLSLLKPHAISDRQMQVPENSGYRSRQFVKPTR